MPFAAAFVLTTLSRSLFGLIWAGDHVTASVALKRLVGFSAKNRFYRANRDLGLIFKNEFILQYLSEPELRRRIRRGLLKVEQLHALVMHYFKIVIVCRGAAASMRWISS
jgi:hypothetical protein